MAFAKGRSMKDGCLIGILAVVMLITVIFIMNSNSDFIIIPRLNKVKYISRPHHELVKTLLEQKYAIIECKTCHLFIDSVLWSECGVSERKNIAIAFAEYSRMKNHWKKNDSHIEVYDLKSKKQIASWHNKLGFQEFIP